MTHVPAKAMLNWCLQVKPDEPWTGRCMKEKIAAAGKRHRCHKTEKHTDAVHACQCSLEWDCSIARGARRVDRRCSLHLPDRRPARWRSRFQSTSARSAA